MENNFFKMTRDGKFSGLFTPNCVANILNNFNVNRLKWLREKEYISEDETSGISATFNDRDLNDAIAKLRHGQYKIYHWSERVNDNDNEKSYRNWRYTFFICPRDHKPEIERQSLSNEKYINKLNTTGMKFVFSITLRDLIGFERNYNK